MGKGKLDDAQRLELTRKLYAFRKELAYDAWADMECLTRCEVGGRLPSEDELWREYEQHVKRQWPAYRDYAMRRYSDGELLRFVDAYWGVAQERMRYADALDRGDPAAAAYRDVLQDHRMRDQRAAPANENRVGASPRDAADRQVSPPAPNQPASLGEPDPTHRAQYQQRDNDRGLDR